MLKNKAVQKLETEKPFTKTSPIKTIMALITNKNNPNVRIVTGIVNTTKIGLRNAFNNANTIATINALL